LRRRACTLPIALGAIVRWAPLHGRGQCHSSGGEALVFELGLGDGLVMRDLARMVQDLPLRKPQEVVELDDPVGHVHRLASHCLQLSELQVEVYDAVQHIESVVGQVVLGDVHVGSSRDVPAPACEAHVGLRRVGPGSNDLGRGVSVRCPVHLVLHGGEEPVCGLGARVAAIGDLRSVFAVVNLASYLLRVVFRVPGG
jgi:hypothetical protein